MAEQTQQGGAPSAIAAAPGNGTTTTTTTHAEGQGDQQLVPGARAERLQDIYAKALGGTLKKLSWVNVAGCYPTVARRAEGVLRTLQQQMASQLQSRCEKEFEKIMESRQVVAKLNELEVLVGEAERAREDALKAGETKEPTPPHTLPPQAILAAHTHPALARHQSQLHARLQATQSQNALLADEALAGVADAVAEETRLDAEHV
ncbi:Nnf1 [Cordyceps fumosorosea ARSEF 2679]|uniref:Nnf1 n=1 Tax=Cordyceps fumosorosea (strain ARSEF 2679) TaxID=1081104 RepID=A0A168ELK1_CORFA|nr:Nnf1 [Cordyceps fumosorosea ARSEF 2679]OAA73955.1 Nnf1 [Cordyceps fumosorosea ARSEF 2679]